ncbi:MAG: DUF4037 domain-containing protein, partial [Chloroflexota bacterium]
SERYFYKAVKPILDRHYPDLPYTAGLIGDGSEVLGYDDQMSTDHDWGPRLLLFLDPEDHNRLSTELNGRLATELPYVFEGVPTSFTPPDPNDHNTQQLEPIESGPVHHRVKLYKLRHYLYNQLGIDVEKQMAASDWVSVSEQRLLSVTAGKLFVDQLGLEEIRSRLAYYPRDVWLYLLAAGWTRIGQEEHLMGRAGVVGDEIGSALIAARLVRDIMRLFFFMEKRYAPYAKWFGTAFKSLRVGPRLAPILFDTLQAPTWELREEGLCHAYRYLAAAHNQLGLTKPMSEEPAQFFDRPFRVIAFHGYAQALIKEIEDPVVLALTKIPLIGGLDQFSDSTDLTSNPVFHKKIKLLYQ